MVNKQAAKRDQSAEEITTEAEKEQSLSVSGCLVS